jgi:hypothetical protein
MYLKCDMVVDFGYFFCNKCSIFFWVTNVQYINFVQKWVKWYVEAAVNLLLILEGLFMYSVLAVGQ